MSPVRTPAVFLLLALAACPASEVDRGASAEDMSGDNGGGSGSGASPASCTGDLDCAAAGPRCCDCPTHAVRVDDPSRLACDDVDCGPMACASSDVACVSGQCTLVCVEMACDPSVVCSDGYATDTNGCLTWACAGVGDLGGECAGDGDCARGRDDCCGGDGGGADTAVPISDAADHDAALMCPASPSCPGGNTCAPDLAARCVQGSCALVAGPLPAGACGRPDLPACPAGQFCTVNASDLATMHGVGVCQP